MKNLKTLTAINKNIKIMGLGGMQLMLPGLLVLVSFIFSVAVGVLFLAAAVYAAAKINKIHKSGNPDPLRAMHIQYRTPKKLSDPNRILKYL